MNIDDLLTQYDWSRFFKETNNQAIQYRSEGIGENIKIVENDGVKLVASGYITLKDDFNVDMTLVKKSNRIDLKPICSCSEQRMCVHINIAFLNLVEQLHSNKTNKLPAYLERWQKSIVVKKNQQNTSSVLCFSLSYLLYSKHKILIEPMIGKRLKSGAIGSLRDIPEKSQAYFKYMDDQDKYLYSQLRALSSIDPHASFSNAHDEKLLESILLTGRCYFYSSMKLSLGEPISADFYWNQTEDYGQKFTVFAPESNKEFFVIDRMWYIDKANLTVGLVKHDFEQDQLQNILTMPEIKLEDIAFAQDLIKQSNLLAKVPPLKEYSKAYIENVEPTLIIKLALARSRYSDNQKIFFEVKFDYQGFIINLSNNSSSFSRVVENTVYIIERDLAKEEALTSLLKQYKFRLCGSHSSYTAENINIADCFEHYDFLYDYEASLHYIATNVLKFFHNNGFKIEYDKSYPFQVHQHNDEWYSEVSNDNENIDWFDLELGIEFEGKKINIVPILNEFLKNHKLSVLDKKDFLYFNIDGNKYISLETKRLKPIVTLLTELNNGSKTDKLRFHNYQSSLLLEMENGLEVSKLRWFGADKILSFAKKLENFTGINHVEPATEFAAQLRPYQQDGLNWLQFLREYGFGGILADDMGLGKTIQALAHICVEKQAGRLTNPCLVIAPTSLMFNWQMEAEKFASHLRVLCLQGKNRHEQYEQLNDYDIVLTTYPLLVKDKEILLNNEFAVLILDEAQNIKNNKTMTTQLALQIKAAQRICLTGTPMENHLGELWSLFNFLMPGLLNDVKRFNKIYRHPIEKNDDLDSKRRLHRLINPFIVRRTKELVAKELPEKIEILHYVELSGTQRDLYETIRVAMQEKIQQEIARLGFSKSHIIILDALLKLRQVCCHPQLVKTNVTKNTESAKLNQLMSLLSTLMEEGRKVLIFSSFTEMLALIEAELAKKNYRYLKLTGQTKNRAEVVQKFQQGDADIFLISLKAGGVGLNLTAADTVIHYDPWWNPAVENQANDRAYRIGQKNKVMVYKLVAKNTVEDKILLMQKRKSNLIGAVLDDKKKSSLAITEDDIRNLFSVS